LVYATDLGPVKDTNVEKVLLTVFKATLDGHPDIGVKLAQYLSVKQIDF
jgi:hypothetical protein